MVDDACPEKSGHHVTAYIKDPRVEVIFHGINLGVGGAVKTGYKRALELDFDVIVKIDGDGQVSGTMLSSSLKKQSKNLSVPQSTD